MTIRIETIETAAGPMHDLVLVQGANTVRLGLVVDDAQQALRELAVWLEDNTMDVAEVLAEKGWYDTLKAAQKAKVPA
jgi:hypothetical protein